MLPAPTASETMTRYLTFEDVMAWRRAKATRSTAASAEEPRPKAAADIEPAPDPRAGYSVEARKGGWHALIGPDDKQVGSSQRTEAEAWALLEG